MKLKVRLTPAPQRALPPSERARKVKIKPDPKAIPVTIPGAHSRPICLEALLCRCFEVAKEQGWEDWKLVKGHGARIYHIKRTA
jgi:hypothetical protein